MKQMRRHKIWKSKKGYNLPDFADAGMGITIGVLAIFGLFVIGNIVQMTIQSRAASSQEEITDAFNILNYLRTELEVSSSGGGAERVERMLVEQKITLGELLVHLYHKPERDTYLVWMRQSKSLLDQVFGEESWTMTVRFPETTRFFNEDGESIEDPEVTFPEDTILARARVTSVTIPSMIPEKNIELRLRIRDE